MARELPATDLTAEAVAQEIVRRYDAWLLELSDRPRQLQASAEMAGRKAHRQVALVERLKDKLFVSTLIASISTVMLVLIALMKVLR